MNSCRGEGAHTVSLLSAGLFRCAFGKWPPGAHTQLSHTGRTGPLALREGLADSVAAPVVGHAVDVALIRHPCGSPQPGGGVGGGQPGVVRAGMGEAHVSNEAMPGGSSERCGTLRPLLIGEDQRAPRRGGCPGRVPIRVCLAERTLMFLYFCLEPLGNLPLACLP